MSVKSGIRAIAVAGLCLVALAAICWQSALNMSRNMDSMMPLSWNVSIRNGGIPDTEFHTCHDGRNIIELNIDRPLPP